MNEYNTDNKISEKKKNVLNLAKIFFAIIIVLTFFSKSLHSWTLPKVKADSVSSGSLTKEIRGDGVIEAKGRLEYYTDLKVSVRDVKASVGDAVKAGDVLLILEKHELDNELKKGRLELKELRLKYDKFMIRKGTNNTYTYEQKLKELKEDLSDKEKDYLKYKKLYESGAESKSDFEIKERDYKIAKLKYDNAKEELSIQKENSLNEIEATKINIEKKELEVEELERKANMCTITAPYDGVIKEMNFKSGMTLNDSVPVYILDSVSKGFELKAELSSEQCKYVKCKDEVRVSIKSKADTQIDGVVKVVKDKKDDINKKIVIIELIEPGEAELLGGEAGEFYLEKKIGAYNYLVPRSAVYESGQGQHVFVLQEKDGPLGTEYYVEEIKVTAGDSDYNNTGIYSGLLGDERIVTYSSKDLSDGSQVILEE